MSVPSARSVANAGTAAAAPARGGRYPLWKRLAARVLESLLSPLAALAPPPAARTAVRRLLIVEPFRLGDVALLKGMLAPLRARFPEAEIHLLVHPRAADLFANGREVDRIHAIALPWVNNPGPRAGWGATLRFFRSMRQIGFDVGIDPRGDARSHAILALAGCRDRVGYTNYLASNVRVRGTLLTRSAGAVPLAHRTAIHGEILRLLGCRPADGPPPPRARSDNGPKRVVISTGAGWEFKLWPEDRWAELARRLVARGGIEVRLIGPPAEHERLDRIARLSGGVARVRVTDLTALLEELGRADLVVSPDSAAVHLASEWFGVPVVALFGPGVVPLYCPRSAGSVAIHHQERFPCAPCLQRRCVRPADPCMLSITVEEVAEAALQSLAEPGKNLRCGGLGGQ